MIISGPQQVTFGATVPNAVITSFSADLVAHTFTIIYGPPPGTPGAGPGSQKVISGNLPAPIQTALENHCQAQVETKEGWSPGSSTVNTP